MRIAIIIPSYNRERLLPMCLDSVLRQTRPPDEILLVDDGSTDGTAALCRRYPAVRYLRQENGGPAAARNLGLGHSTSDYVMFLDSDDILADGTLETLGKGFDAYPDVGAVFGRAILLFGEGLPRPTDCGTWPKPEAIRALTSGERSGGVARVSRAIGTRMLRYCLIPSGAALVRRSALESIGLWDESVRIAEDQDLWLRFTAKHNLAYIEETVVFYRRHDNSMTSPSQWLHFQTGILGVLEKVMRSDWADAELKRKARSEFARRAAKVGRLNARQGDRRQAARLMWRSLQHRPFSLKGWVRLAWYAAGGRIRA